MPSAITFTGAIGPGDTQTAIVYNNVTAFRCTSAGAVGGNQIMEIEQGPVRTVVDMATKSTFTVTLASGVYTITVS